MENNQNNKTMLIIVAVLVVAGIGGWWLLQDTDESMEATMSESAMMEESEEAEGAMMMQEEPGVPDGVMMEESGAMMEEAGVMMEGADAMMEADSNVLHGTYEAYTADKLALANSGDVVLFFHASWCPTCRAADASIRSTGVPDGLAILKLDFDTQTELKKKYGVTVQHTFVQVDAHGNLLKKWTGSASAAAVASQTI